MIEISRCTYLSCPWLPSIQPASRKTSCSCRHRNAESSQLFPWQRVTSTLQKEASIWLPSLSWRAWRHNNVTIKWSLFSIVFIRSLSNDSKQTWNWALMFDLKQWWGAAMFVCCFISVKHTRKIMLEQRHCIFWMQTLQSIYLDLSVDKAWNLFWYNKQTNRCASVFCLAAPRPIHKRLTTNVPCLKRYIDSH